MEEGAPVDAETRREAEVVKQVRESDVDVERRVHATPGSEHGGATTGQSSPNPNAASDLLDDIPEDDMMSDLAAGLSGSFKQQAIKNSKGKNFWETFSESSSVNGTRTTPPPLAFLPRGSSSGLSEDAGMDSPAGLACLSVRIRISNAQLAQGDRKDLANYPQQSASTGFQPPSAAEITRRINNKRRRDDDFDLNSFKRRAVSPGMSVHNSPVVQSPMQRDAASWGSRAGSNGGDKGSNAPSESGSLGAGTQNNSAPGPGGRVNSKVRVGFQGMVDTNDGIMRMSIE